MKLRTNVLCLLVGIVVIAAMLSGCTIAKISGKGSVPLLLNQPQTKVDVIGPVSASKQIMFDYTGSFDASEILGEVFAETNADAIINVVISLKITPKDYLFNLLTLGIANAKTMEITAEAVNLPEGMATLSLPTDTVASLLPASGASMVVRIPVGDGGEFSYQVLQ